MSERYDARLDDVERRLANRAALAAPPGHRDRVLAAVRDTLAGRISPPVAPAGIDSGGMAALVAMALSVMVVAVVPWLVVARAVAPVPTEPRIVAQARAAGIELPVEMVAATSRPAWESLSRSRTSDPRNVRHHEALHLRNLLQGEL
ncbi:MAG: hypothetical protein WCO90_00500 [Planctomycetota bacterium]